MSFREDQEAAEDAARPRWNIVDRDVTASLNGTHQLHRFIGRWGGGDVGQWVALIDAATGEALLDMASVKNAKIAWRADGALLVRMSGQYGDHRLIIVDPAIRTFRDIGIDPTPRPVSELQSAVATAAYELGADGDERHPRDAYLERDFSPDGEILVEYNIVPQRMSHETRVAKLIDASTSETLLTLPGSLYDGSVEWQGDSKARLIVRHYDGGGTTITVDYLNRTYARWTEDEWRPLAKAERDIDRLVKASRNRPTIAQQQRGSLASRLFIAVITMILLIGAIGLGAWYFHEEPKQTLTPLPKFPTQR